MQSCWNLAQAQLREVVQTADFRDTNETEAQVRARRDELKEIVRKRLDMCFGCRPRKVLKLLKVRNEVEDRVSHAFSTCMTAEVSCTGVK